MRTTAIYSIVILPLDPVLRITKLIWRKNREKKLPRPRARGSHDLFIIMVVTYVSRRYCMCYSLIQSSVFIPRGLGVVRTPVVLCENRPLFHFFPSKTGDSPDAFCTCVCFCTDRCRRAGLVRLPWEHQ